jgi:hypothetical protein
MRLFRRDPGDQFFQGIAEPGFDAADDHVNAASAFTTSAVRVIDCALAFDQERTMT